MERYFYFKYNFSGGRMRDWIDKSAYKTFFVQGLPPAITPEDLD